MLVLPGYQQFLKWEKTREVLSVFEGGKKTLALSLFHKHWTWHPQGHAGEKNSSKTSQVTEKQRENTGKQPCEPDRYLATLNVLHWAHHSKRCCAGAGHSHQPLRLHFIKTCKLTVLTHNSPFLPSSQEWFSTRSYAVLRSHIIKI